MQEQKNYILNHNCILTNNLELLNSIDKITKPFGNGKVKSTLFLGHSKSLAKCTNFVCYF